MNIPNPQIFFQEIHIFKYQEGLNSLWVMCNRKLGTLKFSSDKN